MKISEGRLRKIIREKFAREDFRDVYATAQMAHIGQKRRSGEDYFSHPSEVRNIVRRFYPKDRVSELAALLHDSLEDAPGSTVDSPEEMEEFIRGSITDPASGDEVIRVVRALTHEKGGDYQSYVIDLMNDQPALRVKLADMVHNLSSSPSPKQKLKYKSALDAISAQTAGQPPIGISQKHWGELQALTESKQMKITKQKLKKIIKEISAGENWTIGKADSRGTDHLFPDDPNHPLNQRDELATQIRHASKDVHGRKDVYDLAGKSIEELEDILYDLGSSPEQRDIDDMYRDKEEDAMGRDQDLSPEEMSPRRQGMGRRTEAAVKITKNRLRQIIREAISKL